jgi:hypothetical protein
LVINREVYLNLRRELTLKRYFAYVIFCLLFLGFISSSAAQQQTLQQAQLLKQQVPPISVQNVKGNIYQLKGGMGANI